MSGYLARSANLPTGLYILPSVISSSFFTMSKLSQYLRERFSEFFHWSSFSDSSRNVVMATNFVAKLWQNYLPPLHLSLCHSETEWDIGTSM